MKKRIITFIIFTIILITPQKTYADEKIEVKFSKCVDGDTIKIEQDGEIKTVRMLAVDTPESVHPTKEVEYYGKEASEFTCQTFTNAKKIEIEYDSNSDKEDRYGRILVWLFVDDNLFQDMLVKQGYAEVAYLYGDYKYTSLLKDHQSIAEASKIGIWNEEARENYNTDATPASSEEAEVQDNIDDEENSDILSILNDLENIDINNITKKDIKNIIYCTLFLVGIIITKIIKKH